MFTVTVAPAAGAETVLRFVTAIWFFPLFSNQKGREPEPLFECNGLCGVNDLEERKETEKELNFYGELFPEH